jgi:hypothetical protein
MAATINALSAEMTAFAFYNPFDVAAGQQIGGHDDATGSNTQGHVPVVFRANWTQATDVARTNVQGLELVEVAIGNPAVVSEWAITLIKLRTSTGIVIVPPVFTRRVYGAASLLPPGPALPP